MNIGDKVRVVWTDGEEAIGCFLRKERGFAVFEGDDKKEFVALMCRPSVKMEVIEEFVEKKEE